MNEIDLFKSIGEIEDTALQRSEGSNKRNWQHRNWRFVAAVAAVLICVIGISLIAKPDEEKPQKPWFSVTAYAENGELVGYDPYKGYFNSVPEENRQQFPFFSDVDMPLFSFDFMSEQWAGEENPFVNYTATFSYNGKEVEGKDPHIRISYIYAAAGYGGTGGYHILGWFEEPTDIEISVYDRKSGELLEITVVRVCYLPEEGGYELTVSDTKTKEQIPVTNGITIFREKTQNKGYQLSKEQLNVPTDKLVDMVLAYPYIVDLFVSSSPKMDAYQLLKEQFNGLAELENRTDALPVLQTKFQIAERDTIEAILLERLISIYSKMFPLR